MPQYDVDNNHDREAQQRNVVTVHELETFESRYLKAVEQGLSEWNDAEDEKAYQEL